MLRKKYNLVGRRFGYGVVVKDCGTTRIIGKSKYPREYQEWQLQCDCGNTYITTTQHLLGGRTNSCGCLRRENLLGKRFGYGIVIAFVGSRIKGDGSPRKCCIWKLRCDCGNEYETISEYLTNGDCGSCGCKKIDFKCAENQKSDNRNGLLSAYWRRIRTEAKKRGYAFLVTKNEILQLLEQQNFRCALSNEPICLENKSASLDRINNCLPYTYDNIQWVHRTINYMKNTLSQTDFIQWCDRVSKLAASPTILA